MSSNKNSLQEKKLYLKQTSQHFKEMAGKQDDETRKVIANTFSKKADILEDIYSLLEGLSSDVEEVKSQIQQLNSKITRLSSASIGTQSDPQKEKA